MPNESRPLRSVEGSPAEVLLVRSGRGDREAFAGLFDAVVRRVYGTVLRVLRDRAMSEEVAQDVMLEVWRQAPRFDPAKGSALAWIVTIAHRRAVDRVRSEDARRRRDDRVALLEAGSGPDRVAEEVVERDEGARVRAALAGLSDVQREALDLAYYQGFTYRQVSERLDVPLGTVKTRMRDGLLKLRHALGDVP